MPPRSEVSDDTIRHASFMPIFDDILAMATPPELPITRHMTAGVTAQRVFLFTINAHGRRRFDELLRYDEYRCLFTPAAGEDAEVPDAVGLSPLLPIFSFAGDYYSCRLR